MNAIMMEAVATKVGPMSSARYTGDGLGVDPDILHQAVLPEPSQRYDQQMQTERFA